MDTNRPRDLRLVASLEEHEQDRLSVDSPELHGPHLWVSLVFDEIGRASEQAVEAVGDPQPGIGAGEAPHAIPVMAVEEVNIALQEPRGVRIKRTARFAGRFSGQVGELRPSTGQRGFDAANRRVHEFCCLFQRIVEHILEEDAGALLGRQVTNQPFDGAMGIDRRRLCSDDADVVRIGALRALARIAPPQKVNAAIVSDAK
jgi:hypothetical protein